MKYSRGETHQKTHKIPSIRFEDQTLTSCAGLVVFQRLFARLQLRDRLRTCFSHLPLSPIVGHHLIVLLLVVHLLLGYRELRDSRYYRDDPLVKRVLGLRRLPDVATVSRALGSADPPSVEKLREVCRQLVLDRVRLLGPRRLTLDFDGSVLSTCRRAEGTAVGFNKKKKGARSYYPLFCTIAQTGQVFDLLHRAGNVHDSHGASAFMLACIHRLRSVVPGVRLEARIDAAFFSAEIVGRLEAAGVEFTLSVPFERFAALKAMIEQRRRWRRFNAALAFFDTPWKPKSWDTRYRFLFIRERVTRQHKGPLQLDLFIPHALGYDFKVIVTNKRARMKKVLAFHNGRGEQEGIFAELKSQCQMDYVPVRTRVGNQLFLFAAVLAHNVTRELQMAASPPHRGTTEKRTPLWIFQQLNTLRRHLIQRAGRLTRPQGALTLTMSGNAAVKHELLHYLHVLRPAA
jgi:hypothetical protein